MNARMFALLAGIVFTAAGILGFVPALLSPPPADAPSVSVGMAHGYLLGLFPVNVLHNAVHLAIGLWGLAAWRGMTTPVAYAQSLAVFYGALALMGLVPGLKTLFGLIPIHGHDVWLHAVTALAAAWFGFRHMAGSRRDERRSGTERRAVAVVVARERRAMPERRGAAYAGA